MPRVHQNKNRRSDNLQSVRRYFLKIRKSLFLCSQRSFEMGFSYCVVLNCKTFKRHSCFDTFWSVCVFLCPGRWEVSSQRPGSIFPVLGNSIPDIWEQHSQRLGTTFPYDRTQPRPYGGTPAIACPRDSSQRIQLKQQIHN